MLSTSQVSACLPSERSPTVSQLVDPDYVAIEVILGERQVGTTKRIICDVERLMSIRQLVLANA